MKNTKIGSIAKIITTLFMEFKVCYNVDYYNPTFGTPIIENGEFHEIMGLSYSVCARLLVYNC